MRLAEHKYKTTSSIAGQLLFVENVASAIMGEEIKVVTPSGDVFEGEVLFDHLALLVDDHCRMLSFCYVDATVIHENSL